MMIHLTHGPVMFGSRKKKTDPPNQPPSIHPLPPHQLWGHVNLQIKTPVAMELHNYLNPSRPTPPKLSPVARKIVDIVKKNGMNLQPTVADIQNNPTMIPFFIVSGSSKTAAEQTIKELKKACSPAIDAAYIMPPAQLPGL